MTITVSCPACATSFPVDPAKIPAGGVRAQCSECPAVFRVEAPGHADPDSAIEGPTAVIAEPANAGAEPAPTVAWPALPGDWQETQVRPEVAGPLGQDAEVVSGLSAEPSDRFGGRDPALAEPAEMDDGLRVLGRGPEAASGLGEIEVEPPPGEITGAVRAAPAAAEPQATIAEPGEAPAGPAPLGAGAQVVSGLSAEASDELGGREPALAEPARWSAAPARMRGRRSRPPEASGDAGPEVETARGLGEIEVEPPPGEITGAVRAAPAAAEPQATIAEPGEAPAGPAPLGAGAQVVSGLSAEASDELGGREPALAEPAEMVGGPGADAGPEVETARGLGEIDVEAPPGGGAGAEAGEAPAPHGTATASAKALAEEARPSPRPVQLSERPPEEEARSLARSLVADLIAHNPEEHTEALASGTLVQVFGEEIEKSWKEYREQVDPEVVAKGTFFNDALNELLANGEGVFSIEG